MTRVHILDYGGGNIRSVENILHAVGCTVEFITKPEDFEHVERLVFPGVGSFGSCMDKLEAHGFLEPLRKYIRANRPYFGICLGMQSLFASSEESPGVSGLDIIHTGVRHFSSTPEFLQGSDDVSQLSVPHMGWNDVRLVRQSSVLEQVKDSKLYFVHSFYAPIDPASADWCAAETDHGIAFVSAVQQGNVLATQFHPEKSGHAGRAIVDAFLRMTVSNPFSPLPKLDASAASPAKTQLAPRIIACLDVRTNDQGDLVVTKGDQYDVREKSGDVRNLGKPVELAERYYMEGADEVTFLNITSFRNCPLKDQPMLEVLRLTSKSVFVPLTIGGGIRDSTDPDGTVHSALDVASRYFRSGADKVSIGSDAVLAAEEYRASGKKTGKTSIEQISHVYGRQAVVISVDPTRVYVAKPEDTEFHTIKTNFPGPNGEQYCWYQCTIKGGRERRNLGAYELVRACEELGAGEILLNCMDKDGTNSGFDLELVADIKAAVSIPVIASSGAGKPEHFSEALQSAKPDALLAAGIFHRREVAIEDVKKHLKEKHYSVRL